MNTKNLLRAAALVIALGSAIGARADKPAVKLAPEAEKDHASILAMAGDYSVTFRFDETLTFTDAKPSKRELSKAHETLLVVSDTGDFIQLQHLLISEVNGKQMVVKHWRQDWAYQPDQMLVYRGHDTWERVDLSRADRQGAWTQTVYNVDDSPRYSGFGKWVHIGDYAYWQSNETWRPLPRRETKIRDDYEVVVGINRHSLTPEGWAHEQDNYKLHLDPAGNRVLARETGLNTYDRTTDFDFTVAHDYWTRTEAFWTVVRAQWDATVEKSPAVHITPAKVELESMPFKVMKIANDLNEGKVASTDAAVDAFETEFGAFVKTSDRAQGD